MLEYLLLLYISSESKINVSHRNLDLILNKYRDIESSLLQVP